MSIKAVSINQSVSQCWCTVPYTPRLALPGPTSPAWPYTPCLALPGPTCHAVPWAFTFPLLDRESWKAAWNASWACSTRSSSSITLLAARRRDLMFVLDASSSRAALSLQASQGRSRGRVQGGWRQRASVGSGFRVGAGRRRRAQTRSGFRVGAGLRPRAQTKSGFRAGAGPKGTDKVRVQGRRWAKGHRQGRGSGQASVHRCRALVQL